MWLGLEPSQKTARGSNSCGWDSNPIKTHCTWFQDLMKLRFLMPHCSINNLVKDKVIGKKWIYSDSERSTLHRQSVSHHRGRVQPWNVAWLVFLGWLISYANEWEDYSNFFLEMGRDFQDLGHHPLLGLLTVPWNCHGTSRWVISFPDWGSRSSLICHLGPIWF